MARYIIKDGTYANGERYGTVTRLKSARKLCYALIMGEGKATLNVTAIDGHLEGRAFATTGYGPLWVSDKGTFILNEDGSVTAIREGRC